MDNLTKAYQKGIRKAERITIGGTFRGAMPEAAKLYPVDSPEYNVFITGYLSVVKGLTIMVDEKTGLISDFYRKDM